MSYQLEKYNLHILKKIAEKMGLPLRRSKAEMIADISDAFREYEEYKLEKIDKYTRQKQLGEKGKEGTTYLVIDKNDKEYAMKTFRKSKSSDTLKREYYLQKKAAKAGVAPKVYDYDTVNKWILMEKMEHHLMDLIAQKKGILRKSQQERIIDLFHRLDKVGVFHGDANVANYMLDKKGEIYMIDYGFSREITPSLIKKLRTDQPNYKLMTIGLILKLKDINLPPKSYKYLLRHVSDEDKKKYNIEF